MKAEDFRKRFEYFLVKDGPLIVETRCWHWLGATRGGGYPTMGYRSEDGRALHKYAHRLSWELHKGEIPEGQVVCHRCDNAMCTNPDHLFLGSKKQNWDDMRKKKRHPMGERNSWAVLKEEQVIEIKKLAATTKMNNVQIGKLFGVGPTCIASIKRGKTWKHLQLADAESGEK